MKKEHIPAKDALLYIVQKQRRDMDWRFIPTSLIVVFHIVTYYVGMYTCISVPNVYIS